MLDGVQCKNATGGELLESTFFPLCAAHDAALAVVTLSFQGTRNFGWEQRAELRYVLYCKSTEETPVTHSLEHAVVL